MCGPSEAIPFHIFKVPSTSRGSAPPYFVTARGRDHVNALSLSSHLLVLTGTTTTPSYLASTAAGSLLASERLLYVPSPCPSLVSFGKCRDRLPQVRDPCRCFQSASWSTRLPATPRNLWGSRQGSSYTPHTTGPAGTTWSHPSLLPPPLSTNALCGSQEERPCREGQETGILSLRTSL